MRFTVSSAILIPVLLVGLAMPATAEPGAATKPAVAPRVVVPTPSATPQGIVKPTVAPSFGFAKPMRPLARVTSVAPRIVLPKAASTSGFQGFGAAKPPVNFRLTRPAPALGVVAEGAAGDEYVVLEDDDALRAPRCDGYNPCHADNNPAALARKACDTCPTETCAPDTTCDTYTEPCAPRRRVVRRYVVRRSYQPRYQSCYQPCYTPRYRPYYSSCYSRPYAGFAWGVGYGLGYGLGLGYYGGYGGCGW